MIEYKVDREVAAKEIEKWLDEKKVSQTKRESKKDQIESLVCGIMDGDLTVNEKGEFEHTLKFPGDSPAAVKKMVYKQRILIGDVQHHIKNNKITLTDFDGRINCYIQALTGQPYAVIAKMESTDYDIMQSIAVFFM